MAKIKRIVYGGDRAHIVAADGMFKLYVDGNVCATATTHDGIVREITELLDDIREIAFEMDRSYGLFGGFEDGRAEDPCMISEEAQDDDLRDS